MKPTVVSLVNSQFAVSPVFSAGPWIPTSRRKCGGGHPRGPLPLRSSLHLAQARFSRDFLRSDRRANLPLSTVLTEALRLDSSYEATTPSRLDLVLRQQGSWSPATCSLVTRRPWRAAIRACSCLPSTVAMITVPAGRFKMSSASPMK